MIRPNEFKKQIETKNVAGIFVIDTNVWVYAVNYKIDIQELLRREFGTPTIYVPDSVTRELKKIKDSGKQTDSKSAWIALQIIDTKKLPIIKLGEGHTDTKIAEWAVKNNSSVVTNDLEFRYMLKEYGVKVYCLRQKRLLQRW